MPTPRGRHRKPLSPRVKVWLEAEGRYAFGFGVAEMLQAVDRAGSIKQAASDLGKSYRYVWGRIKEAEKTFGRRLVETRVGGQGLQRSSLTPTGRRLVREFMAFRRHMIQVVEQQFSRHFGRPGLGNDDET